MAYTICNQFGDVTAIRLLMSDTNDVVRLGEKFIPFWWICDPCSVPSKRFAVTYYENREPQFYRWYEVILSDDTDADIKAKTTHYAKVIESERNLETARKAHKRLLGDY